MTSIIRGFFRLPSLKGVQTVRATEAFTAGRQKDFNLVPLKTSEAAAKFFPKVYYHGSTLDDLGSQADSMQFKDLGKPLWVSSDKETALTFARRKLILKEMTKQKSKAVLVEVTSAQKPEVNDTGDCGVNGVGGGLGFHLKLDPSKAPINMRAIQEITLS